MKRYSSCQAGGGAAIISEGAAFDLARYGGTLV